MTGPHIDFMFLRILFDALDGPRRDYTQQGSAELGVLYHPLPQMGKAAGLPQATPEKAGRTEIMTRYRLASPFSEEI